MMHGDRRAVQLSRRRLLALAVTAPPALALGGCADDEAQRGNGMSARREGRQTERGRLDSRPRGDVAGEPHVGLQSLGLTDDRDALLFIPVGYQSGAPAPLVLLLHGAGGTAEHGIGLLQDLADEAGLILLAPASRRVTWDLLVNDYGPDVALIDAALGAVFDRYAVDAARVAIGGFSDGASYALSLGITNGDLFNQIIAFSPGFSAPAAQVGRPRVYVSHGVQDTVLPIDRCSRRIVPQLERAGYEVRYREFDDGHVIPTEIRREALDWYLA